MGHSDGPHSQRLTISGLVNASNTSWRGASKVRATVISRSSGLVSLYFGMTLPLFFLVIVAVPVALICLQLLQVGLQAIQPLVPEPAIAFQPVINGPQAVRCDTARAPLRRAAARDQPGPLQHLEVLGDGRQADVE